MQQSPPDAIDITHVRRALVTKLRHHGDVLLASPVFSVLARAIPGCQTDALVYAETAPMLAGHPAIAELVTIDRAAKSSGVLKHVGAERALLRRLRERRYDLLVHLTEHPRGAWLARLLRPRYSVARALDEPHAAWRSSFTHHYKLPRTTPRHTVECNLDALRRLGIQPLDAEKRLVLEPGDEARRRVREILREHALEPRGFVHMHPGSRWLFKCLSPRQSAALVERIVARGWRLVLTGAPDPRERALVAEIVAAVAPATARALVDLTATLSLRELAALCAEARAFVGVDSAPMHIASAMRTPVVAVFGPSGDHEWGPWRVAHRVIVSGAHPCRPCGLDGCGGGKVSECLTTLDVERIDEAFASLVAETREAALA